MRNRIKKTTAFVFILLLGIVLISCVSAQQSPGTYRLGEDALLYQTCANCSQVNITQIILGNKTVLRDIIQMTKLGTVYNFTLSKDYITYPGTFIVSGEADPNGEIVTWNYEFPVSQLAINQTTSQSIGSAIFLVLMVVLMFVFGGLGFRLFKSDKWWILGIFLTFFSSLLLIYNTWLGYQYHRLFTGLPDSAVPERIFWILLFLIVLGLLTSAALLFIHWRKVLRYVKREIKRKPEKDEDLDDWDIDHWAGENWALRGKK